ncbi:metal ABC transporter substrate-binding protein [Streptomyces sp. ST2-7A]|uniref:metal ABC transporter substrate-binding protein n=1 Tax=Streptomyces sp. ST2-7A TaxID=2907214 RepID=UPI001F159EAE|nr:metal ABC transporter substrate-binding protein [Streptomyces sp. ST2-7A]MCE7079152.1 metal ABC transporter substrate-binding protein [Streptomyces sp. ST2-7A]
MTAHRIPRVRRTATAPAVTTALAVLALAACGTEGAADEEETGAAGSTLDVVASFYPMEFLAERVGGEHVSVSTLTEPGVEPHDLELSPRQVGELSEADVVVYLAGLQPAVDEAVEQSGVEHVAEAGEFTELSEYRGDHDHGDEHGHEDDHGHEDEHGHEDDHGHGDDEHGHEDDHGHGHGDDEHADEGHGNEHGTHDHEDEHGHDEDHADEDDHGHAHGAEDPHVWLNPIKYAEVAEGVAETLSAADPDNAADYRRNAEDLAEELRALDTEFEEGLANRTSDVFITTHAAFGYLAERYGLREESIAGLDPESEPSAARMRALHDIAEDEGVSTVFFETLASDATARTLADDLGLETDVLDPLEGITEGSRGDDYFEVMRANLEALRQALGAG